MPKKKIRVRKFRPTNGTENFMRIMNGLEVKKPPSY